jgi:hypothetical protein
MMSDLGDQIDMWHNKNVPKIFLNGKPVRVYITGPIAGIPNGNRDVFAQRARELQAMGYETLNPWDVPPLHHRDDVECVGRVIPESDEHRYGCYLLGDIIAMVMTCQAYNMLPGAENSPGSCAEIATAAACGLFAVTV